MAKENKNRNSKDSPPEQAAVIDELFDDLFTSLKIVDSRELQINVLTRPDPKEIRVLFDDIARDLKPNKRSSNLAQKVLTSEDRQIETSSLTKKTAATAKIVRFIETERKKRAETARQRRQAQQADQQILLIPPLRDRLVAGIIDLFAVATCTFILTLLSAALLWPQRLPTIIADPSPSTLILLTGLNLSLLPLAAILYQLTCLLRFAATYGMRLSAITLTDPKGLKPPTVNLVTRALSSPISFVLLGFITPLLGKRSLADLLAHTRCIQEYSSLDESDEEITDVNQPEQIPRTL